MTPLICVVRSRSSSGGGGFFFFGGSKRSLGYGTTEGCSLNLSVVSLFSSLPTCYLPMCPGLSIAIWQSLISGEGRRNRSWRRTPPGVTPPDLGLGAFLRRSPKRASAPAAASAGNLLCFRPPAQMMITQRPPKRKAGPGRCATPGAPARTGTDFRGRWRSIRAQRSGGEIDKSAVIRGGRGGGTSGEDGDG